MKVRFSHLSLSDRRKIERWRHAKLSPDEMARRLGRHRSTIFRELRRNRFHDSEIPTLSGYWSIVAQGLCDGRRARRRKLVQYPGLRDQVERCLRSGWTPEQIAGRMRYEHAARRVCHETIYRHIYSEEGRRSELWRHLPSGRRRRRGYRLRKRPPPKFAPELSILFRPDVIAHRKEFGHWECDLVLFRQKYGPANVTTMIERTSRFLLVLKNDEKRTKPIMARIAKALTPLPRHACRSVTFDRGSEFIDWPHLQATVGTQTWFCEAQSPWQKGAVENANKRLRRWLCRDTDPGSLSQDELRTLCAGLNATPRKCLGFRTPAEVFKANILGRGNRRANLSNHPKSNLG